MGFKAYALQPPPVVGKWNVTKMKLLRPKKRLIGRTEKDIAGAQRFALKAQNLLQALMGFLKPSADDETIRKHYRRLALALHPDKNKSVGADGASSRNTANANFQSAPVAPQSSKVETFWTYKSMPDTLEQTFSRIKFLRREMQMVHSPMPSQLDKLPTPASQLVETQESSHAEAAEKRSAFSALSLEPEAKSMTVPDPDFHNFDEDRTEKSFDDNQVWAAYDNEDGMTRCALIQHVISRKPFKVQSFIFVMVPAGSKQSSPLLESDPQLTLRNFGVMTDAEIEFREKAKILNSEGHVEREGEVLFGWLTAM
ncbi:hypothetical protein HAX54_051422 [Datura stramonium]|uniref:J domain-containing protein n=1 Tax=Datura stramonium TaxID=4076 RepID=A0ABS8WQ28_DATST|nr:hypothetical protein [Datura stramonium]